MKINENLTNKHNNNENNNQNNLAINNNLINFTNKINNFWDLAIWDIIKSKPQPNIKNKLTKNILLEYKEEFDNPNPNPNPNSDIKFIIDPNYDIIIDNYNKKKFDSKKNSTSLLKLHSDCFYEYHNIIYDYLVENNKLKKYDLDNIKIKYNIINPNITKSEHENLSINFNPIQIKEHLNYFKKKYIFNSNNKSNHNLAETLFSSLEVNVLKISKNLEQSIKSIIEKNTINENIPILLIDTENIFKSFIIQDYLKSHMEVEQFDKYFHTWNNGCFKNKNNCDLNNLEEISLSEYSSKIKYIEPFTSLNLSLKKKIKLINILIGNLVNCSHTINIITSSEPTDILDEKINLNNESSNSSISANLANSNKIVNLTIPIEYNSKFDIREQDDHLIIFIYTLLEKLNLNPIIISNDKFKWFSDYTKLNIKNFKILYDFDEYKKKIIIDIQYTPDIYKHNNKYFLIPLTNYPHFSNELVPNYLLSNDFYEINKIFKLKFKKIQLEDIKKIKKYLYYYSFIENIPGTKDNLIKVFDFAIKYIEYISNNLNNIFEFLSSKSKNKIFKLSLGLGLEQTQNSNPNQTNYNKSTLEENFLEKIDKKHWGNIENMSKSDSNNYMVLLDNYLILIDIYIILKFIIFRFIIFKTYSELEVNAIKENITKYICNMCMIFDYIIGIYDLIDEHIHKIRKLSNSKLELGKIFKKMNILYIFIRKQGFFKKNIF